MEQVHSVQPTDGQRSANNALPTVASYIANIEKHQEAIMPLQQTGPFDDEGTRTGFIQKVLALLLLHFAVIRTIMFSFVNGYYSIYHVIRDYRMLLVSVSAAAFFTTVTLLVYCSKARKRSPYKYIFLLLYPGTLAAFVSLATFDCALNEVCFGVSFLCLALIVMLFHSIFSFQTNFEFSLVNGIFLNVATLIVLFVISLVWVMPRDTRTNGFLVFLFTLVVFMMSSYVMCDVLVMTGNKYRFEVTPADYVLSILHLHIDYAFIFRLWWNNELLAALPNTNTL